MKKIFKMLLVLLVLLFMFVALFHLSFSRPYHHFLCQSTDLSKENINDIYLGENINSDNVRSKYGYVNKLSQDNAEYNYYYLNEKIEVATEKYDDKITRFIVNDKNISSDKDIKIGDDKYKIIKFYGKNYYKRVEQGTNILGYVDRKNKTSLEFWMYDHKIMFFRLDYNYME